MTGLARLALVAVIVAATWAMALVIAFAVDIARKLSGSPNEPDDHEHEYHDYQDRDEQPDVHGHAS